ncbi:MAG: hypothetical protein AAFN93_22815 [Bacteroidota bacterium]
MKRIGFLLLFIPSLLFSQQKKVIHIQNEADSIAIETLLQIVQNAGAIQLSYDPLIIPEVNILLKKGKWTSLAILNNITKNSALRYRKVGKNYILLKQEKLVHAVSGQVFDSQTGEHLIGASVRIAGTSREKKP